MSNVLHHPWLRKHAAPAGMGLIALTVLSMASVSPSSLLGNVHQHTVDIGIEHEEPLSLVMEVGINANDAVVEFFSESAETILISVPSTWVRREVRNAPIHTVTSEAPSIGFTRWTLPARAGISFRVKDTPDGIILHNPSEVQMKLTLNRVNVVSEEVYKDILLIQDDTVRLW